MSNTFSKHFLSIVGVLTLCVFSLVPAQTSQAEEPVEPSNTLFTPANVETTYTLAEVAAKNTRTNCWTIVSDKVYNITSYINSHPGGTNSISKLCGKDGTTIFNNIHGGSSTQTNILAGYKIGVLAKPQVISCPTGSFYSLALSACSQAPKGYFISAASSAAGATAATACPVGKFTSVAGSTACIPAPPGYYVDLPGGTEPKPCQKGYYSSSVGSSLCQKASRGFYVASTGSSFASACAKGYTTASTGSTASSACYKPIAQTIPGFSSPKALKYGASTNLAITTNTKALASYKVSGPCTAKVVSIVTTVNGKNLTTKVLKVTASKKAGTCSVTLTSVAKEKYLAMSRPVSIQISKTGK